jgi:hypothetical protein
MEDVQAREIHSFSIPVAAVLDQGPQKAIATSYSRGQPEIGESLRGRGGR